MDSSFLAQTSVTPYGCVCMYVVAHQFLYINDSCFFTDTESSYGGGESPILLPRRRKSQSASSYLLGLTPGGSVESGNSTSLDIGMQLYISLFK